MSHPAAGEKRPSMFNQPKAVYAVAFACVVSFMGIGLVDPILPAISEQLDATPSQVTLLFTSYLVVTAVAMLITNAVSSRIGAKKTLIAGLALIVVFAGLAGAAGSINGIVGFRAGWGLGNALFIATSLAVIVSSATGGFAGAIILYETALGVGIACGPLLGGLLGEMSWRGPFYGVSVLMLIALLATVFFLPETPKPKAPVISAQPSTKHRNGFMRIVVTAWSEVKAVSILVAAPIKALRHRGLLTMGIAALFYNWAFFTMLGYAPFPMKLSAIQLGFVFFGWGILVAIFAVFGAPWLQRRFGTGPTLYVALTLFAADLAIIAIWPTHRTVLICAVIAAGIFIGINNTLTTQAVMVISPVERPVASAAYGFVRFIGGGLAPFVAGKLVEHFNLHVPFALAAVTAVLAALLLSTAHRTLAAADKGMDEEGHHVDGADDPEQIAAEVGDEFGGAAGALDDFEREEDRNSDLVR